MDPVRTNRVATLILKSGVQTCQSSVELRGCFQVISEDFGGLGARYYEQLGRESSKIQQVDVVNNITETKGSCRERAVRLALEMRRRNVKEGDIILIYSRTHTEQTVTLLATLFVGAIVAPIGPETPYKECLEMLGKLQPKMCFCDTRMISQIDRVIATLGLSSEVITFGVDEEGGTPFHKLFTQEYDEHFCPVFIKNVKQVTAFILPTQGTCGTPKLVCLSHFNMLVHTMNFQKIFSNPEKIITFFPLSWIMQAIAVCACFDSQTVRITPGNFSERYACKLIYEFNIDNAILGTDYAMRIVGNVAIRDFNMSCLKNIMVGNVMTTKHDMVHLRAILPHVHFLQAYMMTEVGCVAATCLSNYDSSLHKPESVGKILNNGRLRIMDIESGSIITVDKLGELYFSGDGIMLGYYKDVNATENAMEQGFFKTGDLAKYDEEGWLYVEGRLEDMITIDAEQRMCPMQLEDTILAHPLIHEVVVIGNSTDLVACIMKKPESNLKSEALLTEEKLTKYINDRIPDVNLRPTKIVFFEEFPRTSTGNIKKYLLREKLLSVTIKYVNSLASIT